MPTEKDDYPAYYRELVRAAEANVSAWNDPDLYEQPAKDTPVPVKGMTGELPGPIGMTGRGPADLSKSPPKPLGALAGCAPPNVESAAALQALRDRDQRTLLERMGLVPPLSPDEAASIKAYEDAVYEVVHRWVHPPTPEEREADDGQTLRAVTVGHDDTVREHWLHRGVYTPEPAPDPHVRIVRWGVDTFEFEQETPWEAESRRRRANGLGSIRGAMLRYEAGRPSDAGERHYDVPGLDDGGATAWKFETPHASLDDRIREVRKHRESDCSDPGCRVHRRPEREKLLPMPSGVWPW